MSSSRRPRNATIQQECGAALKMKRGAVGVSPVEEAPACFLLDAPLEGIP